MKDMKNPALEILGEPTIADLEAEVSDLQEKTKALPAPKIIGDFSAGVVKSIGVQLAKAAEAFGLPAPSEVSGALKEFPADWAQMITMISEMIADAVEEDVLSPELTFDPAGITNDLALIAITGKVAKALGDKGFKRWLKEEMPEVPKKTEVGVEVEVSSEPEDMSDEDYDKLFMSRM